MYLLWMNGKSRFKCNHCEWIVKVDLNVIIAAFLGNHVIQWVKKVSKKEKLRYLEA